MTRRMPLVFGALAMALLLLGFVAGAVAFAFHGLGYLAAFPFWLLSALLGLGGLIWSFARWRPHQPDPDPTGRGAAIFGVGLSAMAAVVAGVLSLFLATLLAVAAVVAVAMLMSHPL
jgi:hypothetical protein